MSEKPLGDKTIPEVYKDIGGQIGCLTGTLELILLVVLFKLIFIW